MIEDNKLNNNISNVLQQLGNWLVVQQRLGIKSISSQQNIKKFMDIELVSGSKDQPSKPNSLMALRAQIESCDKCILCKKRTKTVFGEGPDNACLMLVGEAPGREEDLSGRPFIGISGQLLTRMLRAVGLNRSDVFITSIVKCRPPNNRTPRQEEIKACYPFLMTQIRYIRPNIILALGQSAAHCLLNTTEPLKKLRQTEHSMDGIKIFVTYHPAFLLRLSGKKQIEFKRKAWEDLQLMKKAYDQLCQNDQ